MANTPLPYGSPFFGPVPTVGNVFFVGRGYANAADVVTNGTDPLRPFQSIDYAIGRCTANNGDVIYVMPAHTDTISAASGIAADVAGVTIEGLSSGALRPIITLDTANTADIAVSAANVVFRNLVFSANFADIVRVFNITATGCWIDNCAFRDTAVSMNVLTPIKVVSTTDNACDRLKVTGCSWVSVDAASVEFIEINGNLDELVVSDCTVLTKGTAAPLILCAGTKVLSGALITGNVVQNANTSGDTFINNGGSTGQYGIVAYNVVGNLDVTGAQDFGAATGLQFFESYSTSTSTEGGALAHTADTPLS